MSTISCSKTICPLPRWFQ